MKVELTIEIDTGRPAHSSARRRLVFRPGRGSRFEIADCVTPRRLAISCR